MILRNRLETSTFQRRILSSSRVGQVVEYEDRRPGAIAPKDYFAMRRT